MTSNKNQYEAFNKFQGMFYTSIPDFASYTRYDVVKHGYTLLNNLAKGFPNLADMFLNVKGIGWSGPTSHAILCALQRKFVNQFRAASIPKFIYFKNNKSTSSKTKQEKQEDSEIIFAICNSYILDRKSFEHLNKLGYFNNFISQYKGEFEQTKKLKSRRKQK